jgi:hypothetical protein
MCRREDNIKTKENWVWGRGLGSAGLWPVMGSCEHGNDPSASIKREDFPDRQNDYQLWRLRVMFSYIFSEIIPVYFLLWQQTKFRIHIK